MRDHKRRNPSSAFWDLDDDEDLNLGDPNPEPENPMTEKEMYELYGEEEDD